MTGIIGRHPEPCLTYFDKMVRWLFMRWVASWMAAYLLALTILCGSMTSGVKVRQVSLQYPTELLPPITGE